MRTHCEARVKKALEALPEVVQAAVSHEEGTAVVTLKTVISDELLKKAVEAEDYTVTAIAEGSNTDQRRLPPGIIGSMNEAPGE